MKTFSLRTCTLRALDAGDAESIARYANNPNIARNLRDHFPSPYSLADAREFLKLVSESDRAVHFAIEVSGEAIGVMGVHRRDDVHRLTAEIGYWIGEPFWGRGIATEAVIAVTDDLFETTDLVRLDAIVYSWNPASSRVLEKAGYTREALLSSYVIKNDQVLDGRLYARTKGIF
ncbi:MAG: GNAT family N-acetyltransferase [Verrucomicrobiae bacterium]|nr:GNAT family N-acetyltransferase [Verrucomicrobiae bacterium]